MKQASDILPRLEPPRLVRAGAAAQSRLHEGKKLLKSRALLTRRPRAAVLGLTAVLLATGTFFISCSNGSPSGSPAGSGICQAGSNTCPIKHIVIIVKENHSFDNLFDNYPGAVTAKQANEGGRRVAFITEPDKPGDITHTRDLTLQDIDGGQMDGFYKATHLGSQKIDYA